MFFNLKGSQQQLVALANVRERLFDGKVCEFSSNIYSTRIDEEIVP